MSTLFNTARQPAEVDSFRFAVSGLSVREHVWGSLDLGGVSGCAVLADAAAARAEPGHALPLLQTAEVISPAAAPTAHKNTEQAGLQITRHGYSWMDAGSPAFPLTGTTVTFSFAATAANMNPPGTAVDDRIDGFSMFNATQIQVAYSCIQAYEDISKLNLVEVDPSHYNNGGTILFANYSSGADGAAAFAAFPVNKDRSSTSPEGDVWINSSFDYNANPTLWNYGFQVITHELGHAIGLEHPGAYNAGPGVSLSWENNAEYIEDTRQYTVMSYFDESDPNLGANYANYFAPAPLMDDIEAVQRLYGADFTTFSTNTTYGFSNNTGRDWYGASAADSPLIFCAWDPGGNDTFDFSGYNNVQKIDLESGRDHFSNVGGLTKNVSIFDYADADHPNVGVIENAIGGSNVDEILGNSANNRLEGRAGNDTLWGYYGADTLQGGDNNDTLHGGDDNDSLDGGLGNDVVYGEEGDDSLIGGATDNDTLEGGNGNDTLDGGLGVDRLVGGAGDDTYTWYNAGTVVENASEGVDTVRMAAGNTAASFASAHVEKLIAVTTAGIDMYGNDFTDGSGDSNVITSIGGSDRLFGLGGKDTLIGGDGNDTLDGGAGADSMDGGLGNDTFLWNDAADKVVDSGGIDEIQINTATVYFSLADANITGVIENLSIGDAAGAISLDGNDAANTLTGNASANTINGRDGADTIVGRGGKDRIFGDDLSTAVNPGADRLSGDDGDDTIYGAAGADTVTGGANNDFLFGGTGDDSLNGNLGDDWADGEDGNDTLIGGAFDKDTLNGGAGNDLIDGGSGNDQLRGGAGNDTVIGNDGDDNLGVGNGGRSTISGGAGSDVLLITWSGSDDSFGSAGAAALTADGSGYTGEYNWSANPNDGAHNRAVFSGIERFSVETGGGADTITTGGGIDTITTGAGDDLIRSGGGADVVNGGVNGAGGDRWITDLSTGSANIVLNLNSGSQSFTFGSATGTMSGIEALGLVSDQAADVFRTGSGADTLTTRAGFYGDNIATGAGADTVKVYGGRDLVALGTSTGAGDVLAVDWSGSDDSFRTQSLALGADGWSVDYYWSSNVNDGAHNRVQASGVERFNIALGGGADWISTADGADTISSGAGADVLRSGGGAGADSIDGGSGADTWIADMSAATAGMTLDLSATQSTFTVGAQSGSVTRIEQLGINSADAADVFRTGGGADVVVTSSAFLNDNLATGLGDDVVTFKGGRDLVNLGGQATTAGDVLALDWSATADAFATADLTASSDGYGGDIYWRSNSNDGDHNRLQFTGAERFNLTFGAGADAIRTGDGADTINAGGGDDTIRAGAGADAITGGAGRDVLVANQTALTANTTIDLTQITSNYTVGTVTGSVSGIEQLGLSETERFVTGAGNDTIVTLGGFYNDAVNSGDGRDTVKVAGGRDLVAMGGQTGAGDLLIVDWSASTDTFVSSAPLADTVSGSGYSGEFYWQPNSNDGAHNRVAYTGVERFSIAFGGGDDQITTGDAADTLSGGGGNDILRSGAGADVVDGGANTLNATGQRTGPDIWVGDKSAATAAMVIDLTAASSSYTVGLGAGSVAGIEQLGRSDTGESFVTGSGADAVTTLSDFYNDFVITGGGSDTVTLAGGRDVVAMGAGASDLLVINWASSADQFWSTAVQLLADGYTNEFYWRWNSNDGDHNRVAASGVERFDVATGSGDDQIHTGDNDDVVKAGAGDDVIWTGAGADTIDGGANSTAGADIWIADKSAAAAMTLNLSTSSTYTVGGVSSTVVGVEQLGVNDGVNAFTTGAGDDVITTSGGFFHDYVVTGAGADTVTLFAGRDRVDMGAQAGLGDLLVVDWSNTAVDSFRMDPLSADATGLGGALYWFNNGNDGAHNRVDFTGAERFSIATGGGADTLRSGDGADTLSGGAGADVLFSGKGVDVISGGANDVGSSDIWVADKSAATAAMVLNLAAASSSYVIGGATGTVSGIEQLGINDGSNVFSTGSGDDVISTHSGFFHDWLSTGAGADTVSVFAGRDLVEMGGQTGLGDLLVVDWSNQASDRFWSGALSSDANGYRGVFYWLDNGNDGAHNRVDFTGVERFNIATGGGADWVATGDNADSVNANAGDDTISSGKGVDVITGGLGIDRWIADKSFATDAIVINLQALTAQTYLGTGSVRGVEWVDLKTGAGDDVLTTGKGFLNDILATNAGSDTVSIFGGRDVVDMGAQGAAGDTLVLNWSGSADNMRSTDITKPDKNGLSGTYYWISNGNDGAHNRVDFSGVEQFNLTLGAGSDTINTGDGADTVRGGAGDDIVNTGRGQDNFDGGDGVDYWIANKFDATDDMVLNIQKTGFLTYGTTGQIRGVEGIDLITGGGADKITTGLAFINDRVSTRAGNDVVSVFAGRDYVEMGTAGGGGDRLVVDWSASGDSFRLDGVSSDATGYGGAVYWISNGNDGAHNRVDFLGVERFNLKMGSGADTLTSGDGADTLSGGVGADVLSAAGGADKLFGGDGADTLAGGDGDDNIAGGGAGDILTGGLGKDTFAFSTPGESTNDLPDLITDLEDTADRIDLKGLDANINLDGDQKFNLAAAFTHVAGQLVVTFDARNNRTLIQGDTDGDGAADFTIWAAGDHQEFSRFAY